MEKEKDIWVDEVMDSLSGMQRLSARTDMYEGIITKIKSNRSNLRVLLPRVAAAAILLLAVNILSVYHAASKAKAEQQTGVYEVVNEQISNLTESSF